MPINIYLQNSQAQEKDFKKRYRGLPLPAHTQAATATLKDKIAQIQRDEKAVELIVIDSAKLNQYFKNNQEKYKAKGIVSPGQLIHRLHTKVAPCYYNDLNVVNFVDNNGKSQSGVLGVNHDGALAKAYQEVGYLSREEIAIAQECLLFMRKAIAVNDTGRYNAGKHSPSYKMYGREKTLVDFAGIRLEDGAPQREVYVKDGVLDRAKYKETYKKSVKAALMAIAMKAHSTGRHAHFRECGRGNGYWASRWKSEIAQILAEIYQEIYEESTFIRKNVTTVFPWEAYGDNFVLGAPEDLCDSDADKKIGRLTANCLGRKNKNIGHYYKKSDLSSIPENKKDALLDILNPKEGELYFEGVAGDGGAMFGNEFWIGKLGASGDPAAACGGYMAARIAAEKSNTPWPITYSEGLELKAILGDDVTVEPIQNGDLKCRFSDGQEYDVKPQNVDVLRHIMSLFHVTDRAEFLGAMNAAGNINYTLQNEDFKASITTTNLTDFYGTALLADLLRQKCDGLESVSLQGTTLTCAFSNGKSTNITLNEQMSEDMRHILSSCQDGTISQVDLSELFASTNASQNVKLTLTNGLEASPRMLRRFSPINTTGDTAIIQVSREGKKPEKLELTKEQFKAIDQLFSANDDFDIDPIKTNLEALQRTDIEMKNVLIDDQGKIYHVSLEGDAAMYPGTMNSLGFDFSVPSDMVDETKLKQLQTAAEVAAEGITIKHDFLLSDAAEPEATEPVQIVLSRKSSSGAEYTISLQSQEIKILAVRGVEIKGFNDDKISFATEHGLLEMKRNSVQKFTGLIGPDVTVEQAAKAINLLDYAQDTDYEVTHADIVAKNSSEAEISLKLSPAALAKVKEDGFKLEGITKSGAVFEKKLNKFVIPYSDEIESNTAEGDQAAPRQLPEDTLQKLKKHHEVFEALVWLDARTEAVENNPHVKHSVVLDGQEVLLHDENISYIHTALGRASSKQGREALFEEVKGKRVEAYTKRQKGLAKFAYFALAILGVIPALVWWATRKSRLKKIEEDALNTNGNQAKNPVDSYVRTRKREFLHSFTENFKRTQNFSDDAFRIRTNPHLKGYKTNPKLGLIHSRLKIYATQASDSKRKGTSFEAFKKVLANQAWSDRMPAFIACTDDKARKAIAYHFNLPIDVSDGELRACCAIESSTTHTPHFNGDSEVNFNKLRQKKELIDSGALNSQRQPVANNITLRCLNMTRPINNTQNAAAFLDRMLLLKQAYDGTGIDMPKILLPFSANYGHWKSFDKLADKYSSYKHSFGILKSGDALQADYFKAMKKLLATDKYASLKTIMVMVPVPTINAKRGALSADEQRTVLKHLQQAQKDYPTALIAVNLDKTNPQLTAKKSIGGSYSKAFKDYIKTIRDGVTACMEDSPAARQAMDQISAALTDKGLAGYTKKINYLESLCDDPNEDGDKPVCSTTDLCESLGIEMSLNINNQSLNREQILELYNRYQQKILEMEFIVETSTERVEDITKMLVNQGLEEYRKIHNVLLEIQSTVASMNVDGDVHNILGKCGITMPDAYINFRLIPKQVESLVAAYEEAMKPQLEKQAVAQEAAENHGTHVPGAKDTNGRGRSKSAPTPRVNDSVDGPKGRSASMDSARKNAAPDAIDIDFTAKQKAAAVKIQSFARRRSARTQQVAQAEAQASNKNTAAQPNAVDEATDAQVEEITTMLVDQGLNKYSKIKDALFTIKVTVDSQKGRGDVSNILKICDITMPDAYTNVRLTPEQVDSLHTAYEEAMKPRLQDRAANKIADQISLVGIDPNMSPFKLKGVLRKQVVEIEYTTSYGHLENITCERAKLTSEYDDNGQLTECGRDVLVMIVKRIQDKLAERKEQSAAANGNASSAGVFSDKGGNSGGVSSNTDPDRNKPNM